jgi:hypothetical protein
MLSAPSAAFCFRSENSDRTAEQRRRGAEKLTSSQEGRNGSRPFQSERIPILVFGFLIKIPAPCLHGSAVITNTV